MKVNISDKISSEVVKAIQESGQEYVVVNSRFTDIETDKFLILVRNMIDVKYIEPVVNKAKNLNKSVILVLNGGIEQTMLTDIAKLLIGCSRVNIPIVNLTSDTVVGKFVKNMITNEQGRGGFNVGEIKFTPSYLIDKAGINISQATSVIESFPQLEVLKQASIDELTAINGIGKATAKKILEAIK